MSKLFQISEEDLASMEQILPELMSANMDGCNDPIHRKRFEMAKSILSNVRWGYGPPSDVEGVDP